MYVDKTSNLRNRDMYSFFISYVAPCNPVKRPSPSELASAVTHLYRLIILFWVFQIGHYKYIRHILLYFTDYIVTAKYIAVTLYIDSIITPKILQDVIPIHNADLIDTDINKYNLLHFLYRFIFEVRLVLS